MNQIFIFSKTLKLAAVLTLFSFYSYSQQLLDKPVTVSVKGQPVSGVLKTISEQGKFYFSYNSDLIPGDSLVTLNVSQMNVKAVLGLLFRSSYQYKEKGDYIIILPAAKEKVFYVNGHIFDQETNNPVDYASVYSRQMLISTLSEDDGHFRLRIKDKSSVNLTISKVGYGDTTIVVNAGDDDLRLMIHPRAIDLDPLIVRYSEGEATWLGRLFLSARLRAQSRNIGRFFVALPYQASLTPGLGTHGRMSSQVVNKFSLNLLGGYTAGVNGVEIAGGFNISKKDVRYVQIAGMFNVVSGTVRGVQMAGFLNQILDTLGGVQVSGFSGNIQKNTEGVQLSGFLSRTAGDLHGAQVSGALGIIRGTGDGVQLSGAYNHVKGNFYGVQIAGGANFAKSNIEGGQLSGGINIGNGEVHGFQLAPLNYAKKLRGTQLGIINIADSSAGLSLGLLNFIRKSTSNVSVYASELMPWNLAWKMGTHKFYSILLAGSTSGSKNKAYVIGAGFGREFFPFRKVGFFTEITSQTLYLGNWEETQSLYRFQAAVTWKLSKRFLLFAGPSFSIFDSDGAERTKGYRSFPPKGYPDFDMGNKNLSSWIGWQGGISWRYGRL